MLVVFSGMNGQPLRIGCIQGNSFVLHTKMIGPPAQVPAEAPEPANPVGPGQLDYVAQVVSLSMMSRYSLGGWNCEHFASWCATGVAWSRAYCEVVGICAC